MVVDAHAPMKRNKYEVKMAHPEKTCEGEAEREDKKMHNISSSR